MSIVEEPSRRDVLVVVEHDRGVLAPATLEALTFARSVAAGGSVTALMVGAVADDLATMLGGYGADHVVEAVDEVLVDYGPEAWGQTVVGAITARRPDVVLATGTDVGNEVMAFVAAALDVAFAANCTAVTIGPDPTAAAVTRVRWGGSLVEEASLSGAPLLLTVAHHAVEPVAFGAAGAVERFAPGLDPSAARSIVTERVEREAGLTLATAPVVVGGGRGVGSAEAFAPLEELAAALGGVVGCSRAVTNNGWRNHTDQVGQTGTRIAPDLYIACGISGAVQHWVGAMASKRILAVNTDPDANMVTKADYAVIGDLHTVVPAIITEINRRRS